MKKTNSFFRLLPVILLAILLTGSGVNAWGQIVSDGLNNTSTLFTITGSGAYYTGNSATGDRPASSPFASEGTHGYGVNATSTTVASAVLTTTNNINTTGYSALQLSFKLAAFSIGSTGNGLDGTDAVTVEISTDGTTYTTYLTINGFSNAYWPFTGSNTATTAYPTVTTLAPTAGGSSTTPQYGSVTITSLPATTTLKVRITMSNNATAERWIIDDFKITGTPAGNTSPSLSTPTSASITNTSATLGASITYNGGDAITESGIVYGTSATPTGNATPTSPLVSLNTAFTVPVTSLSAQTLYYYRGYAINTIGTGYSSDGTFRTLSNAPTFQATGLTSTLASSTTANLTWSAATFPVSGATTKGYVLLRATSPITPSLGNANGAAPTAGANTTIVSSSIAEGATSQASSGLAANTTYNYLLVPYCWDGTNAATYNYLTAAAPIASVITPSNLSDVVAVASSETANISSLINDAAPLTSSTGAQVWQFTIRDGGSTMNDDDNLPTIVSAITFAQQASNTVTNWSDAIKTVALFDGTTWLANAIVISNQIQFSGLNVVVADNSSKTLSVRLSVNANMLNSPVDGKKFVFSLAQGNFTTLTDGTSSTKWTSYPAATSLSTANIVDVVATKLNFVQQPSNITINTNISPSVTVEATDIGGNRDKDFVSTVEIIASGATLTGSPVSSIASAGLSTFSTLQLSTAATGVTLTATYSGLTDATSNTFDVTLPLSAYIYRSLRTGNWNGITSGSETWERTTDGTNWTTVTSSGDIPNSSAGVITIKAGHTITVSSSIETDELTIEATAQITIEAGQTLTIANGIGTDATINGILKNTGTLTNNGQMAFGNGSNYEHNINGGTIPTATWDPNSTIEVTGVTSIIPSFSSSVTYGNVTWNCSGQTGTLNLLGNLKNIAGNFLIQSTGGSGILRLSGGASNTFIIGGNIEITGSSSLQVANAPNSGSYIYILNIGGNFYQTGGTFSPNTGSYNCAINFTGNGKTFTQSSGTLTNTLINWTINNGASITFNNNIPVASSRSLTVNGTLNCSGSTVTGTGAFTLASGGTLKTANTSGLNGSITVSGTKTLSTGANYEFNGSSAQVTGSLLPATVNNLTIDNSAGVTLSNTALTVNGTLLINSGKFLEVGAAKQLTVIGTLTNNAGNTGLVIKSDATGTGSLIHSTAGVSATVERYISGPWNWHFLSSPVSGQKIVGATNFIDFSNNPENVDFYRLDATNSTTPWINIKNGSGTLNTADWIADPEFEVGTGYLVSYSTNVTKSFAGTLNAATVSPALVTGTNKANLIGNPFTSAIDWDLITKTGLQNGYYYIYNDATDDFEYYLDGATKTANVNGKIPAMQAFYVVNNSSSSISLPLSARVHNSQAYLKSSNTLNTLNMIISNGTKSDETKVLVNSNASNGLDWYDATKMFSFDANKPQIYSIVNNTNKVAFNSIPTITTSTTVPVGILVPANGNYSITADGLSNFSMCTSVTLEDLKTNTTQNLIQNPVYNFIAATTDNANRFVLHFATSVGVNEIGKTNTGIYAYDNNIYINGTENIKQINIYNALGQLIKTVSNVNGLQKINMNGNASGYYIVRVICDKNAYSEKVLVK